VEDLHQILAESKKNEKRIEQQQDSIKGLERLRDQHLQQAAESADNVSISPEDNRFVQLLSLLYHCCLLKAFFN